MPLTNDHFLKLLKYLEKKLDSDDDTNSFTVIAQKLLTWYRKNHSLELVPQVLRSVFLHVLQKKPDQIKRYYHLMQEMDRQMNTNYLRKIILRPFSSCKIATRAADGQKTDTIFSLLEWSVLCGWVDAVDFLLTQHEDAINFKNIHNDTLFHVAMLHSYRSEDNIKMLKLLLSKVNSSNLDTILQQKNDRKDTFLYIAACKAQISSVHYLFEKKYYSIAEKGQALFFRVLDNLVINIDDSIYPHRYNMLKMAEYLLQKSPIIVFYNRNGQTPYDILFKRIHFIFSSQGNTDLNVQEKETIKVQLKELYFYLIALMIMASNHVKQKPIYSVNWNQSDFKFSKLTSQKKIEGILNEGKKKYEIAQHYNAMIKKNQWSYPSISVSKHYLSYPKGVEFFHRCISDEHKQQRLEITRLEVNKPYLPSGVIFIITRFFIQNLLDEPNTANLLKEIYPIIDTSSFNHQFYSMLNGLFESQVDILKKHILKESKGTHVNFAHRIN